MFPQLADGRLTDGAMYKSPIQIPARSQYVKFIDEIFAFPIQTNGTIEVLANGSAGSANFNITALLFDGQTFTTLNPATVR